MEMFNFSKHMYPRSGNDIPVRHLEEGASAPSKEEERNDTASDHEHPLDPGTGYGGDIISERKYTVNEVREHLDENNINKKLRSAKDFETREGYNIRGLPELNSLAIHDIPESHETKLWELEVKRLVKTAKSIDPPSLKSCDAWFQKPANHEGYHFLHRLGLQFGLSLDICTIDDNLVFLERCPASATKDHLNNARKRVCRNFDDENSQIRDNRIAPTEGDNEAFHALVDYTTDLIMQMVVRTMDGCLWIEQAVSALAKLSAKLKVVGWNLSESVGTTLDNYDTVFAQISRHQKHKRASRRSQLPTEPPPDNESQCEAERDNTEIANWQYYKEAEAYHSTLNVLVRQLADDLVWDDDLLGQEANNIECSCVTYQTGFDEERAHIFQDRDDTFGTTSDQRIIDMADIASERCLAIWSKFPDCRGGNSGEKDSTTLRWTLRKLPNKERRNDHEPPPSSMRLRALKKRQENGQPNGHVSQMKQIRLRTVEDVIRAMMPFSMYCGRMPEALLNFTKKVILASDPTRRPKYWEPSGTYIGKAQIMRSEQGGNSTRNQLGKARGSKSTADIPLLKAASLASEEAEEFAKTVEKYKKWTIDDKSITIHHRWYSWLVLGISGILLIGGGVALIAIEDRALGVDPSNLTALAWAAAGFVMIFFKSRRVQDWPWRDFLYGRVVCRSVTEVCSVTDVNAQHLIAVVLRRHTQTRLRTRGPFNVLFQGKTDDGFSIDIPLRIGTIIRGGSVLVMVDGLYGRGLVAISQCAKGYSTINSRGSYDDGEAVVSKLPKPTEHKLHPKYDTPRDKKNIRPEDERDESQPLYSLCTNGIQWSGIEGIFWGTDALFD